MLPSPTGLKTRSRRASLPNPTSSIRGSVLSKVVSVWTVYESRVETYDLDKEEKGDSREENVRLHSSQCVVQHAQDLS